VDSDEERQLGLLSTSNGIPLPSDIPTAEETNAAKLDLGKTEIAEDLGIRDGVFSS
jgi:hypothetical protein